VAAVPATHAEIHDSLERARSYALLWVLMRDENLRRAEEIERDCRSDQA
jgi:hypothetical protein